MSKEVTYTKVVDLIQKKQFEAATTEIKRLKKDIPESIQLILLSIYCKIENNQLRSAMIVTSKTLKIKPDHQLLLKTKTHIEALKSGKRTENPLAEFVDAFITYTHSKITDDPHQFNQLMNQILIKPSIK